MKNTLYLICTVCRTPLKVEENVEKGLINYWTIICSHCKQTNIITQELKDYVKNTQEKG